MLASLPLQATTEWTQLPTYFEVNLEFIAPTNTDSGRLVFTNENPSGLSDKNKEKNLLVKFVQQSATNVQVFFNNDKFDPNLMDCGKVYAVNRIIPKTQAVARTALEELFKGPTLQEKNDGYVSNIINQGVKIQSLTISNGVARVDFDETLQRSVGGSCRVAAIRSQIENTLKQFPTVKSVIISINGRTEDILQP